MFLRTCLAERLFQNLIPHHSLSRHSHTTLTLASSMASNDLEKHSHPSGTRTSAARRVSEGVRTPTRAWARTRAGIRPRRRRRRRARSGSEFGMTTRGNKLRNVSSHPRLEAFPKTRTGTTVGGRGARRASSRGPRDGVRWPLAREGQIATHRGPQQKPDSAASHERRRRDADLWDAARAAAPRGAVAKRRRRDRAAGGPMASFLRPEQGGTDLVVVPTMRREENGVRGPAPAQFHSNGGWVSFEC